jgi:tetratricopeptide (TPR) repeat protein
MVEKTAMTCPLAAVNLATPDVPQRFIRGFRALASLVVMLFLFMPFSILECHATSTAATPTLIVLPPANSSGAALNDWLAYGIQDSMTVDLWHVTSLRTLPLTEFGAQRSYNMGVLRATTNTAALEIGRQVAADQVWYGEYTLTSSGELTLTYTALDVTRGSQLYRQELHGNAADISTMTSQLVADLLAGSGVTVTNAQLKRIMTQKTGSARAFEQNALSFSRQVQMFAKSGHKYVERMSWAEHGRKAVALDPSYAEAYINLGWAYHTDHSYDAALSAFTTAVTLKPYLLDGWMGIGYVQRELGQKGMAIEAFQKAVSLHQSLDWPQRELKAALTISAPPPIKQNWLTQSAAEKSLKEFQNVLSDDEKVLVHQAESGSLDVRLSALKTLARTKDAAALPFLDQMINRQEQAFEVLKLMVDISIPHSTPYLTEVLEKRRAPDGSRLSGLTDENVLGVLQLIKRRSLHQTTPTLINTLTDSSPAIRERTALMLGDFGATDALEPLKKMVAAEQNRLVRTSALVALVALGDNEARRRLETLFKSGDDKTVINHAIKLLKQRKLHLGGE